MAVHKKVVYEMDLTKKVSNFGIDSCIKTQYPEAEITITDNPVMSMKIKVAIFIPFDDILSEAVLKGEVLERTLSKQGYTVNKVLVKMKFDLDDLR